MALTVLTIALVFVVGGLQTGMRAVKLAGQLTEAELLAQAKMAELQRTGPFDNASGGASGDASGLPVTSGDFGPENPEYRWETEVSRFADEPDLWKLKVAVSWMEKGALRQVELVTLTPAGGAGSVGGVGGASTSPASP